MCVCVLMDLAIHNISYHRSLQAGPRGLPHLPPGPPPPAHGVRMCMCVCRLLACLLALMSCESSTVLRRCSPPFPFPPTPRQRPTTTTSSRGDTKAGRRAAAAPGRGRGRRRGLRRTAARQRAGCRAQLPHPAGKGKRPAHPAHPPRAPAGACVRVCVCPSVASTKLHPPTNT